MLKEIWITRHGFREDWVTDNPRLPTQRAYDPPLAEVGRQQAQELGLYLRDKGIERVYSSPFYRCLETIYPFVTATDTPLYIDNCMSEWYGYAHPKYLPSAPIQELQAHFPKLRDDHVSSIPQPVGQESTVECHLRVKKGVQRLVEKLDQEQVSSIALVGHAASVICVIRGLLEDQNFPVKAGTCSLTKLVRREDGSWSIIVNGDCSHLSLGEQRAWMFSDSDIPDYERKVR